MNIVMFGPPGAGKGTQGKRLAKDLNLKHISFGEVLRKHVKYNTVIGKEIKKILAEGQLVGTDIVAKILKSKVPSIKRRKGVIFDGFPRCIEQAKFLDDILEETDLQLNAIVLLDVPSNIVKKRIATRAKIEGREDDQSYEKIANRLQVYYNKTLPACSFYKEKTDFYHIDGTKQPEDVYNTIKNNLENSAWFYS